MDGSVSKVAGGIAKSSPLILDSRYTPFRFVASWLSIVKNIDKDIFNV